MKINFYDKIIQIELTIEEFKQLSIVELKELLGFNLNATIIKPSSSSKPTIDKPVKSKSITISKEDKPSSNLSQVLTKKIIKPLGLHKPHKDNEIKEQLKKDIKKLSEDEFLNNQQIAERLGISHQLVNYWRKKLVI
jgi:DNA-binding transcriptional regulator YiaG